jgi:RNA polymerase sigma-70 factor (ECF subfamily)
MSSVDDAMPSGANAQLTDAVLLARMAAGDSAALDALLERYWRAVFQHALRRSGSPDAAADIAQAVFCRLWDRRTTWTLDGSLRGLLFRLVRNEAVTGERQTRARERATDVHLGLSGSSVLPIDRAERAELRAALAHAIDALPDRRREVFLLRVVDGLSHQEIAEVMEISKQTVANQLTSALTTLRSTLGYLLD